MGFFSWRKWLNREPRSARRSSSSRSRFPFQRLELERLEERLAPATDTWSGLGADIKWGTAGNWSAGVPNNGDDLVFPSGVPVARQSNSNNLGNATFNSISFSGNGYTLAGNPLTLGGTTALATGQINVNPGLTETISLNMQLGGAASGQQNFTVGTAGFLTISGAMSGTAGAGLTKLGPGTLTLSGSNGSFTGAFTVAEGIVQVGSASALGTSTSLFDATTVQANAQLQVLSGLSGPISETLLINGAGPTSDGVLLNVAGANIWAGSIIMDSSSTLGATAGSLDIQGQITDLGAGYALTKEGAGQIILSHSGGNTYRGSTTINNGILTIQDPNALGNSALFQNSAIVNFNQATQLAGTLQIDNELSGRPGFVVANELLTLNGPGVGGIGALHNLKGNNTWSNTVTLGSPSFGSNVNIGVASQGLVATDLLISGLVRDPTTGAGPFTLTKVGTGKLIFTNSNTYLGATTVAAGTLNVEDSQALGPKTKIAGTTVSSGAALELQLQADNIAGLVPRPALDSVTNTANTMTFADPLAINLTGINTTGALHSISGINIWSGTISLNPAIGSGLSAIGVEPDPNPASTNGYFTTNFSLTVTGNISGNTITTLEKVDNGQLILPKANTYQGPTDIHQGWITAQNAQSIGTQIATLGQTNQPYTTVEAGAALHLKPLVPGTSFNLPNNLVLAGLGITHPFALIGQQGALENLDGPNTVSGIIKLNGIAGIGVEQAFPLSVADNVPSQLILTGTIWDFTPTPPGGGGITKLGSQRLIVQGPGTYTGPVDIQAGVVLDQNDTGLGGQVGTTTVETGAALELGSTTTLENGGIQAGLNIWGEHLILNGTGNASFGDAALTILSSNSATAGPFNDPVVAIDNLWNGPVTLASSTIVSVQQNSRVTLLGLVDDAANPSADGSSLTMTGPGELDLGGQNTFRGTTFLNQGVMTLESSQALGGTGVAAVQSVALTGATPNVTKFRLTFTGKQTGDIPYTGITATDTAAIKGALDGLDTVKGKPDVGGVTTVTQTAPGVFSVSFGGTLLGFSQLTMSALVTASGAGIAVSPVTSGGGGTVVANGASLQLEGGITIAGEPVILQGPGNATTPTIPTQWFQVGPAPTSGGQTPGNENVTGRITGIAVDPNDANVIYISTGGGGAWKTIDGGKTWRQLFDAIPDVQTVTVNLPSGSTFTLSFTGADSTGTVVTDQTASIAYSATNPNQTAADIQTQLTLLSNIGGVGGLVTVTQSGKVFTVTFGGRLAGYAVAQLTTSSASVVAATVENGLDPSFAMYVGAIAIDNNNPNIIYLGTGETNNSPDSFYGTGVYKSTDAGITWSLVLDNVTTPGTPINPFFGKGISKIIVTSGVLFVADGDGGTGRNEVQTLTFSGFPFLANTFDISFTGPDSTGTVVTDTAVGLTYFDNANGGTPATALEIQNALDAFSNIGGVGGFVTVTPPKGGKKGNPGFTVQFQGNLSLTTLAVMTTNWPLPGPSISPPTINVVISSLGGPLTVVNGTQGGPGIWRFSSGAWFNMTAVTSNTRATLSSAQSMPPAYVNPPKTPGPDDNYLINFPQTNATWSDVAIINGYLYGALGTSKGGSANGVYWSNNPFSITPVWYVGNPDDSNQALVPDKRDAGEFPTGAFNGVAFTNGNIKISGVAGGISAPGNANSGFKTIYASVANPNGTLLNVYLSQDGGEDWAPVGVSLPNYLASQGAYSNSILAVATDTVYVGGTGTSNTGANQILKITGTGGTFLDISGVAATNGPHVSQHALVPVFTGSVLTSVLAASDGGIWNLNATNNTWTDINGNLAISQFNSVSPDPTDATMAFGGLQSNGTQQFNDNQTWTMVDDTFNGQMTGSQVFVDQTDPSHVYAVQLQIGNNAVVRRSTQGGIAGSWTTILQSPTIQSRIVPLALDAIKSNRLLVGGGLTAGLYESADQGNNWTNIGAPTTVSLIALPGAQGTFVADTDFPETTDIGANTYDPNTIYVSDGTTVYLTKNHAQSWTDRSTGTSLIGGAIVKLVVDPRNRDTVYAVRNAFGGGSVFQSTDAGQDWTEIGTANGLPNVPAWTLVVDPRNNNLYVGTDLGVFELAGATGSWVRVGAGLPNVQVKDLVLNQTTNTLLAGTYGRSMFEMFLTARQTAAVPVAGALVAMSSSNVWTGPVILAGATTLGADGNQAVQNGITTAQLNIVGPISDLTASSNPTITKLGQGNVVFSGPNIFGGETHVQEGVLIADNPTALSGTFTLVDAGTALQLESSISNAEPLTLNGDGPAPGFNGHNTGALESIANNNTYSGPITLGTTSVTIGVDSGSTLTITGAISGPGDSLTKELTGTLIFDEPSGTPNTYSGTTFVHQGALQIQSPVALQGSIGTTVLDGAQIQLASPTGGPSVVVAGENLDLSGTGINGTGAFLNVNGNNTWAGPITLDTNPGFTPSTLPAGAVAFGVKNAQDTLTISGVIGNLLPGSVDLPSGLSKVGPGILALANANTYEGTTYVTNGIVTVQDPKALGTTNTQEQQRVVVSGTTGGTFTLTFQGKTTGALPYNAPATGAGSVKNALDGLTTIGGVGASVGVTLVPVTSITLNGPVTYSVYTVTFLGSLLGQDVPLMTALGANEAIAAASPVAEGGSGTIVSTGAALDLDLGAGQTVTGEALQLNGPGVNAHGALDNIKGANTWAGPVLLNTSSAIGVVDVVGSLHITGVVSGGSPAALSKVDPGTLFLDGTDTYQGTTLVQAGILSISNPKSLGGTLTSEVQTVNLSGAISGTFSVSFKGIPTAFLAYAVPASGGPGPTDSLENALNALFSINAGGGSVTVTGSSPNYTVTFNGGPLAGVDQPALVPTASVGTGAAVTVVTDGGLGGTVVSNGASLQVTNGITVTGPTGGEVLTLTGSGVGGIGALDSKSGVNTWDSKIILAGPTAIAADANSLTLSQTIAEAVAGSTLTLVGPATVAMSGAASNTYTGTTFVNNGTLQLNKTGAIAIAGNLTVGNATAAPGSDTAQLVQSNQIATTAMVTVNDDGIFDLNNQQQTVGGGLVVNGGVVKLNGAASVLTLTGGATGSEDALGNFATISGPGTLSLASPAQVFSVSGPGTVSPDMLISSVIGGPGGLTKSGTGTLQLTANNTFAGTTLVTQGLLLADGTNPTNTVGAVSLNGVTPKTGTLGGIGTVGTITSGANGGAVTPGDPANPTGTLNSGVVTWNANTNFNVRLDGTDPGQASLLNVTGTVNLGGATLIGTLGSSFIPAIGGVPITIMTATGTISNAFVGAPFSFIGGLKFNVTITNAGAVHTVTIQRIKADTTTTITVGAGQNPSVFGQDVTFTATVAPEPGATGIPAGTVDFVIDSATVASGVPLVGGQAFFKTSSLAQPLSVNGGVAHTVTVSFNDTDLIFNNSNSTPFSETVKKASTQTLVSSSINPSVFGQVVTFTAAVSALGLSLAVPTGKVDFFIDGVRVSPLAGLPLNGAGKAFFLTSSLAAPLAVTTPTTLHTVVVNYINADGNFVNNNGAALAGNQTVNKADTTTTIASTNGNAVYGEPIITATVAAVAPGAGNPTGTVTFSINNGTTTTTEMDSVGSSQVATLQRVLAPGVYTINATYVGDGNFKTSSSTGSPLSQIISKAGTTVTTVTSNHNPSVSGQPVTFTATIAAVSPGGTVTGSLLPQGTADLMVDSTTVASAVAVVNGQVTFNPTATITNALTAFGSPHGITVVYNGDTNYAGINGNLGGGGQTVNKAATSVLVASNTTGNQAVFGQPVTFSATITPTSPGAGAPGGTANLVIDSNTVFSNVAVTNGAVTFNPTSLFLGVQVAAHQVKVEYNGDASFIASFAFLTPGEKISKAPTTTAVSTDVNPAVYGQVVNFTATVTANNPSTATPTGTVVFLIDNVAVTGSLGLNGSGKAFFSTASLVTPLAVSATPHAVTVNYTNSDGNFSNSGKTLTGGETVNKAGSTTTVTSTNTNAVYGEPAIVATVVANAPGAGAPTGTVTFTINNGSTTTNETDSVQTIGGVQVAKLQQVLPPLAGSYTITAAYSGDTNFLVSNSTATPLSQTVSKANTSVTVFSNHNSSVFGQAVIFSATIAAVSPGGTAAGSVLPAGNATATLFIDGSQVGTAANVVAGQVSFPATTTNLTVLNSPHTVQVIYSGDSNYSGNNGFLTAKQTVVQSSTTVGVSAIPNPSVFGQPVTFSATITPVSPGAGTVGGTANLLIDGNTVFSNVTVTTGAVSFPATTSFLTVSGSPHQVKVVYNGDINFAGNNAFLSNGQTVGQAGTTTAVSSSSSTSNFGQQVTFTATVAASNPGAGTPTGNVNFYDGSVAPGNLLGSGGLNLNPSDQATYQTTITQLTGGVHTIIAVYQSDSSFTTSQGSTAQTVQKANTTTSAVTTSLSGAIYGQAITFSATVSAVTAGIGVPTGTINFYDGPVNGADLIGAGTVNGAGKATLTLPSTVPVLPALSAGNHTITAVYQSDTNFNNSTSPNPQLVQTVTKATSSTTLATDHASAVYGQETITATVADTTSGSTGTPTGNVKFTIVNGSSSTTITKALVNGVATLTSPAQVETTLTAGSPSPTTYTISAAYQGDNNFGTSSTSSSLNETVSQANSSTLLTSIPANNQSVVGQQVTFTATVTAALPGAGLPTGTVNFYNGSAVPGNQIGTGTLSLVGGQEQVSIQVSNFPVTTTPLPISAVYQGDANFITGTSNTVSFTVNKAATTTTVSTSSSTSAYGNPVGLTATVSVNNPGAGIATGNVTFYDGAVDNAHLLGVGGLNQGSPNKATYTTTALQLTGGVHSIIAVYQGDTSFLGGQGSASQTVSKVGTTTGLVSSRPTPIVGRPFTITATVSSSVAGLSITGGSVSFIVDGGGATLVGVNGAGQATLIVTLTSQGNHNLNANYGGDSNFSGSSATTLVVSALTPNGGFVAQVYRDLLHREVDPNGLASWTAFLDQGFSRTQFVSALESSVEYRQNLVDAIYVHYLHRHADLNGLNNFVAAMGSGMTDETVASILAGSPEYFANRGGNTVDGFLTALYADALNRPVDSQGRQSFTLALSFNTSRQQVASAVLGSLEYKQDLVTGYYNSFLHRNPDPNGLNGFANAMTSGVTDEQVIAILVGSPEYYNNI